MRWNKANILLVSILGLLLVYFAYSLLVPVDCKYDKECFDKKAKLCMPAAYHYEKEGNVFKYRILGTSMNNTCSVEITLEKVSLASPYETKKLFEGKSMTCYFPKEQLKIVSIQETSGILNYCTGKFKEATLELMIKKLYGAIAQNLGSISQQISTNQTQPSNIPPIPEGNYETATGNFS